VTFVTRGFHVGHGNNQDSLVRNRRNASANLVVLTTLELEYEYYSTVYHLQVDCTCSTTSKTGITRNVPLKKTIPSITKEKLQKLKPCVPCVESPPLTLHSSDRISLVDVLQALTGGWRQQPWRKLRCVDKFALVD
jgi:hypothetical protein